MDDTRALLALIALCAMWRSLSPVGMESAAFAPAAETQAVGAASGGGAAVNLLKRHFGTSLLGAD